MFYLPSLDFTLVANQHWRINQLTSHHGLLSFNFSFHLPTEPQCPPRTETECQINKMLSSSITLIVLLVSLATAFPRLDPKSLQELLKRGTESKACPFSHFNAHERTKRQAGFDPVAQRVSTTGKYAWKAPNLAAGDKRGPCPGLNALANHGYLPHNGIAPATTIIQAVNQGMSMSLSRRLTTPAAKLTS